MFDFQPDQQEVYPTNDDVFEVVFRFRVLKFNMQAILDSNIHLDRVVSFRRHPIRIHPDVLFTDDVRYPPGDRHAYKVPELHIDAIIRFVLLLYIFEVEWVGLRVLKFAWSSKFLTKGEEFVVITAIEKHF